MKNNRREFLRSTGLSGMGLIVSGMMQAYAKTNEDLDRIREAAAYNPVPVFNMCGYAAPKLDMVRIGVVGIGSRGYAALERLIRIEGVEIRALCDIRAERTALAKKFLDPAAHKADVYDGHPEAWKKLCERNDLDLIYILTPWAQHTAQAVFSMNHGKHVCLEVPAAKTIEECWQLVKTSERTRKHCMMMENCCYDFSELLTLNMAQQGFFGEVVHCEGAYIHNLKEALLDKNRFYNMWELVESFQRKGNLYPTHGLGPLCQVLNINRGDRMDYLVSMSTNDFVLGDLVKERAGKDAFFKPFAGKSYNGNMNTSLIRTEKGKSIMVQYDVSSERPYTRHQLVSGTKGIGQKYPEPARYATGHEWMNEAEYRSVEEKYTAPILKKIGELAKNVGGHGGMDFIMDWRTIDCLRNGIPPDQDVYDAALWSAVSPLSVWSVANRSEPIKVPDFTGGAYRNNKPVDLSMETGGNTKVL